MPPTLNNFQTNQTKISLLKKWHFVIFSLSLLVIAACTWGLYHAEQIRDWYILETYKPTPAVVALANEDTMTSYAKQLFYVNRPSLDNKPTFANNCPEGIDNTYVIGCYHTGDRGIYLLNVQDSRLNGIVSVTAAYEMLHAGYARLSNKQKTELDKQMWSFYLANVKSTEIHQQMASYALTEPGAKYDELYSVLATEVTNLPPSLNNAYSLYFTNRAKIVSMYDGYQAAFNKRQSQIKQDDANLKLLKNSIASNESRLNLMYTQIINLRNILNQEKANNQISSYNSGVVSYNNLANTYNSLIIQTKIQINSYNNLVNQRNALAISEKQLIQELNSSSLPSKV